MTSGQSLPKRELRQGRREKKEETCHETGLFSYLYIQCINYDTTKAENESGNDPKLNEGVGKNNALLLRRGILCYEVLKPGQIQTYLHIA